MTEIQHIRCDVCGRDVITNERITDPIERSWTKCRIGLQAYDYCPACWTLILQAAQKARHERS